MMMNSTAVRNRLQLRGPRPPPLTVNKSSSSSATAAKIFKKSKIPNCRGRRSPVIVYLRSPKIIHVRPEEFKSFVQRLTGNNRSSVAVVASSFSATGITTNRPGSGEEFVSACDCIPS